MEFHTFIKNIISKTTSNQDFLDRLTDPEAMALYKLAFIHKSVDPINNYETLEFKGDTVLNAVSVIYLTKRFPEITDEGLLTGMKHFVTEKKFFARMTTKIGFDSWIQIVNIPEVQAQAKSIKEDVFEAFNGAFFEMCEKKIMDGSGWKFVYNLVEYLLEDEVIPITKASLQKPRAVLKEIVDTLKLPIQKGDMFITTHEPRIIDGKERNINQARVVIGGRTLGYAESFRMDDAKDTAAVQALDALQKQGITFESAKSKALAEKRRTVDKLLARFKAKNPKLNFIISTIKKSDKNSDAIVGYYIESSTGNYELQFMERGASPELAEEIMLNKLLHS